MWILDADQRITIWRFMVDKNHQNKGIGRKALSLENRTCGTIVSGSRQTRVPTHV
ncbi:hypothetical protein XBO1_480029 [Xenorhabdus bovienii str. oregonense]|uniref:Uncharacterized protein n=2 Tax=Xenorhabdus bovienii TaxID=40576 RepID=A0A077PA08_XENBV|nr:GNAT family N-acetyltransferase [Xenorhabdus bovienii]CDH07664.1 hypothetical protein XBO1_480029 [Xenorhabdus bovienii str. oregonense]